MEQPIEEYGEVITLTTKLIERKAAKKQIMQLKDVSKSYLTSNKNETVRALEGISLDVYEGEFLVILGPSGCGKSTLLNLFAGFERPTQGEVFFKNREITAPSWERAIVFQEHGLFPWMTVRENIEFGLKNKKVAEIERKETVSKLVKMIGLEGFENKLPKELSGGMKQRVGIARTLAVRPSVIIMDEPFGALDAQTRAEMQRELLKLWAEKVVPTAVFVTHSIDEAMLLADRIVIISSRPGTVKQVFDISEIERPRDIVADPIFIKLNLDIRELLYTEKCNDKAELVCRVDGE